MTVGKNQSRALFYALTAVFFWSTIPTAIKLGVEQMSQLQLLTGAALISVLVLGIILLIQGKQRMLMSTPRRSILRSALLGLLNPFAYYLILFKSYSLLPGQVAQPLNMIWPLLLVLFSIPMLKQNIGSRSIIALLISFGGVVLISIQGGTLLDSGHKMVGVILALSSAVMWALYWIFNMKSRIDEILNLFLIFIFSSIYLVIALLLTGEPLPSGWKEWAPAAYIGIFEMGLAFALWLKALQLSHTTASISNLVYIAPFLNLIFVHLFLDESIYLSTIFGIILVVTGIIYQNSLKGDHAKT